MSSSSGRAFIVKTGKGYREGSPRFKSQYKQFTILKLQCIQKKSARDKCKKKNESAKDYFPCFQ